tara:strand:- start:201 stop:722 length:522 start_codon:yes stop_codon:yes gene_type:complete
MNVGKLVKIAQSNITTNTALVTLTGIDVVSPHFVVWDNVFFDSNSGLRIRVTSSGSPDTGTDYDYGRFRDYHDANDGGTGTINDNKFNFSQTNGTSTNNANNGYMWLMNFADSSKFSSVLAKVMNKNTAQQRWGREIAGGFHSVAEANNGISFFASDSNNIANGNFCLYRLVT